MSEYTPTPPHTFGEAVVYKGRIYDIVNCSWVDQRAVLVIRYKHGDQSYVTTSNEQGIAAARKAVLDDIKARERILGV